MKLRLIKKVKIKKIDFSLCKDRCERYCYLCREFNDIEKKDLEKFIKSKTLYIYKAIDLPDINRNRKCPWCEKCFDNLKEHIKIHNKSAKIWYMLKIHLELYNVLLNKFHRKGKWDSFGLLPYGCNLCDNPMVLWDGSNNERPLRCALSSSPKNRMRCIKVFGIDMERLWLESSHRWKYGFILG